MCPGVTVEVRGLVAGLFQPFLDFFGVTPAFNRTFVVEISNDGWETSEVERVGFFNRLLEIVLEDGSEETPRLNSVINVSTYRQDRFCWERDAPEYESFSHRLTPISISLLELDCAFSALRP